MKKNLVLKKNRQWEAEDRRPKAGKKIHNTGSERKEWAQLVVF
jgi:hypothetical protein